MDRHQGVFGGRNTLWFRSVRMVPNHRWGSGVDMARPEIGPMRD
jgi:hypothetical protein